MAISLSCSAIVGQDETRSAPPIAAVDPTIGGVRIFGDRGIGVSTAVRALPSRSALLLAAMVPLLAACARFDRNGTAV